MTTPPPNHNPVYDALSKCLGCSPDQLPTLPPMASKLTQVFQDDTVSARAVAAVIGRDPALSAQILKVANSPFYGSLQAVDDLGHAVTILGLEEVHNLAMGLVFMQALGQGRLGMRLLQTTLWRHSVAAGLAADWLAKTRLKLGGGGYTMGLLHDLGKLAVALHRPRDFKQILELVQQGLPWAAAELQVLGCDHAWVSGLLLAHWGMPDRLVDAVAYHHTPWDAGEHESYAALVMLSNQVAHRLEHCSYLQSDEPCPSRQLGERATSYLAAKLPNLEELLAGELGEKMERARGFIENF